MANMAAVRALPEIATALVLAMAAAGTVLAQDEEEILPEGAGRDVVAVICSGCHSLRLVAQQGMSERRWGQTLDRMEEEQGMAALDAETRETVLGYLTENLSEQRVRPGTGTTSPFSGITPLLPPPAGR